jgi:hypothetical protein
MRLCSGRGFGCGLGSRLLRGLAAGTHVPALALICPIHVVVPVGSLRRQRIRRCKTIIGACGIGHPDVYARNKKCNNKHDQSDQSFPWHDPLHHPEPRKTSLQNSTAISDMHAARVLQRLRPSISIITSLAELRSSDQWSACPRCCLQQRHHAVEPGLSRSLAQLLLIFVGIDLKPHQGTEWSGFRLLVEFLFALESSYQRRDAW